MPELTAIKNAGAHIISTYSAGPAGLAYSKQWGELKIPAVLSGLNVEAQRLTHWQQTGGLCNYESMLAFFAPVETTSRSLPFYNNFVSQTGETPTSTAATYDAIYVLKEAAERAGTISSEAMVKSLEKTDFGGAQGRLVYYTTKDKWPHDLRFGPGYITFFFVQWRDGVQKVVWPGPEITKIKGAVDYKLPPWMVEYWKKAAK
jgi:branched-chain amino acid transport system substrate-binding protein